MIVKFIIVILFELYLSKNQVYQSHSFNDLDFLKQNMVKSVQSFKMDISLIEKESCLKFSTFNGDLSYCQILDNYEMCCLGFRGDMSQVPLLYKQFNTTDDFIQMINDQNLDFMLKKDKYLQDFNFTKQFALNFQFDHPDYPLVKDFLFKFLSTIEQRNLDITITLGGNSQYVKDYYQQKCLYHECDEADKKIGFSDIIWYDSSSYELFFPQQKFQFNVDYEALAAYCQLGWPDWAQEENEMFYHFWEPSSEQEVQSLIEIFESNDCQKDENHSTLDKIKITSNQQPEMHQLFMQKINNTDDNVKLVFEDSSNGLICTINDTLIFVRNQNNNVSRVEFLSLKNSMKSQGFIQLNYPVQNLKCHGNYLLITSGIGFSTINEFDQLTINPLNEYHYNQQNFLTDDLLYSSESNKYDYILFSKNSETNLQVTFNQDSTQIIPFEFKDKSNFDISIIQNDDGYYEGILKFKSQSLIQEFQENLIYGIFGGIIQIKDQQIQIFFSDKHFDFGRQPKIQISRQNSRIIILETHTDGLCQCGYGFNNNDNNKCIYHEDHENLYLLNTKDMINYSYGFFEDFKSQILNKKIINGCSNSIIHAKLYQGQNPQLIYYDKKAYLIHDLVSYDKETIVTRAMCGATGYEIQNQNQLMLMLNSFDLISFQALDAFNQRSHLLHHYIN